MPKYTEKDPLHFAVQEHDGERVQQLLREGYEVDVRDSRGATPLIVASRWGHNDLIDLLIKAGAKINTKDKASRVEYGGRTALYHACMIGRVGTVKLLLENGAKPDILAQRGHTALSYVISAGGNKAIITLLLENGASPNGPE